MIFVSAILPTYNRRKFVPQAIEYFLRQDYPERELVIIDDGEDSIRDLVPEDQHIKYFRRKERTSLGAKRNAACEEARGDIIIHWDDDDWMASWRMSYQVGSLIERRAEVCGLSNLFFYEPSGDRAWQYVYPRGGRYWVAGATLCYTKEFWRRNPFPNINVGEDTRFVWSGRSSNAVALDNNAFYVAMIHGENTSPKRTWDARYRPHPVEDIRRLMGADL